MHPALSVIFFTTVSGAGYGLLTLLGLGHLLHFSPANESFQITGLLIALLLVCSGLLSSTLHLGQPRRAWRALSQWRSSWLSREGLLAILTFIPLLTYAAALVSTEAKPGVSDISALLMSTLCMLTVYSTAMIYASLKTVHAWCNHWVPAVYLVLALMTGMLLFNALLLLFAGAQALLIYACLFCIIIALLVKLGYWRFIRQTASSSSAESATGLGALGKVSLQQSPHSQENYLLKEMGFAIARKHADKLRRISIACAFVLPFMLCLLSLHASGALAAGSAILAALSALLGVMLERWLFFAEARHTVMLYYGKTKA